MAAPNTFFDIPDSTFNFDVEQKALLDNMNMLHNMSVEEATLYKKWEECILYKNKKDSSEWTKKKIWVPKDIYNKEQTLEQLRALRPTIKLAETDTDIEDWLNIRIFSHTMSYDMTPGRMMKFLIKDEVTDTILGAVSLSSDVTSITVRDNAIGWNDEHKFDKGRLRNTSIASCIMSTQPFGYNFLGGKLMASLLTTQYIRDCWKRAYNDELVGITTTSLYGINSMYNGIPYWKAFGESAGKMFIKPDDKFYSSWHQWVKENKADDYARLTTRKDDKPIPVTGVKQRILTLILKSAGIQASKFTHGFKRGVFFSPFYDNYKEFLTCKIEKESLILKERVKSDLNGVVKWWLPKAERRYTKLIEETTIKPKILYYNNLPFQTWEECKQLHLADVGKFKSKNED